MKRILIIGCLSWVWISGCALQQDVVTLDNRTIRLERQMAEIGDKLSRLDTGLSDFGQNRAKTEEALRGQSAELRATLGRLTEQIQELSGRMDELDYQSREQLAGLQRTVGQLDERVKKLEAYLNVEAKRRTTAPAAAAPAPKPASESDVLYDAGMQLFDDGKYAAARKTFTEYLKKFPKSQQADNAQFWIAETYYREKWLEKAILEYQKVIEDYPSGNKVPASLLKQALAFADLGDKSNAKLILQELIAKYPKSNEAKIAKDRIKQL